MVSLRLFAGTNIGLRENNEDNFIVCPDLVSNEWIVPSDSQKVIKLGSLGCIMVVADGMGGQNAGEVASAIAIDTVKEKFSPKYLPTYESIKPDVIKSFLKKAISECDIRIKKRAEEDPSTYGMGSTIVIAWLIGQKLYVAWLGDSRAYSFIKDKGIARLSKDHSYVQRLVDAGAITEEEAMNHPNSNVITRSLGDNSQRAKADVVEYDVADGEIFLLCSDGLCGVCSDEVIGGIIESETDNLQKCKEKLTDAALASGGSDNITIALMQIHIDSAEPGEAPVKNNKKLKLWLPLVLTLGICLLAAIFYGVFSKGCRNDEIIKIWIDKDTLSIGEKTAYHIFMIGDNESSLEFDNILVEVNTKDSLITVKDNNLLNIKKTYIKVVCRRDSSVVDSVPLFIRPSEIIQIEDDNDGDNTHGLKLKELIEKTDKIQSSNDDHPSGTDIIEAEEPSSGSSGITPSKIRQDTIKRVSNKSVTNLLQSERLNLPYCYRYFS